MPSLLRAMLGLALGLTRASTASAAQWSLPDRVGAGECADPARQLAGQSYFDLTAQILGLPSPSVLSLEAKVTAALLISIKYGPNFKVITERIAKEQYVLTQCGTTAPTDAQVTTVAPLEANFTRKFFTIPLPAVVAESTVQLGFFAALGLEDRVRIVTPYATGPCWQKSLACGAGLADSFSNATALTLQRSSADAVFMDCGVTSDCSSVNAHANGVAFSASQDNGLLQSAEYVKFVAAFFNKELEATAYFDQLLLTYPGRTTQASARPLVAFVSRSSWPEDSLVLSCPAFKAQLASDAGAALVNCSAAKAILGSVMEQSPVVDANPAAGSLFTLNLGRFCGNVSNASAALFKALGRVDVLVDETYAEDTQSYNLNSTLASFGISASDRWQFLTSKKVLRYDGILSATGWWDWFESRFVHPDWAVQGLTRAALGDASKPFKYFRNLALGEVAQVVGAAGCTKSLPTCTNVPPKPVPMLLPRSSSTTPSSNMGSNSSSVSSTMPSRTSSASHLASWSSFSGLLLSVGLLRATL